MRKYLLLISYPKNIESLLTNELILLGLQIIKIQKWIYGIADLLVIYKICLWSRFANHIFLFLYKKNVCSVKDIYKSCIDFHWDNVFYADKTIYIKFFGISNYIRNTIFGSQVIKDGIVDFFRKKYNSRPLVDKKNPNITIYVYLINNILFVSMDLIGYSLHKRGYRIFGGISPLKENIASSILYFSKWTMSNNCKYLTLHDPCCGSGTIIIEAAMIINNIAPGLLRNDQSFVYWIDHDHTLWNKLKDIALRSRINKKNIKIIGTDINKQSIYFAKQNADRAGVLDLIELYSESIFNFNIKNNNYGILITNPPYGKRSGQNKQIISSLYIHIEHIIRFINFKWTISIFSIPRLLGLIKYKTIDQYTIYNGRIKCKLYIYLKNRNIF